MAAAQDETRSELASFLRARRNAAVRSEHGLPAVGRNREVGLRREEVSALSGVSVTWYTWLEQGRSINPSRQVLDSVAAVLRLSEQEHHYVLRLAGYTPRRLPSSGSGVPEHLQRFLDSLADSPAFALTAQWDIAGWNRSYAELNPNVAHVRAADRNLLSMIFTDPSVRALLPDWPVTSARFLAEFRAAAGPRLHDDRFAERIARVSAASADFRAAWAQHDVDGFQSRLRTFHHPSGSDRTYEQHQMRPSDAPDVELVVYAPVTGVPGERAPQ